MSECAFGTDQFGNSICSDASVIRGLKQWLNLSDTTESKQVIEEAKKQTKCKTESCIYKNAYVRQALTSIHWDKLLQKQFKPEGPWNSEDALGSDNIHDLFHQWQIAAPDFQAIEFQVLDFADDPHSTLAKFDWIRAFKAGFRCFAVFINTATYQEAMDLVAQNKVPGKHWFGLFFDFRTALNQGQDLDVLKQSRYRCTPAATIEYFNSLGRDPCEPIATYMHKVEHSLRQQLPGLNVFQVTATTKQTQFSDAECGIFTLTYFYKRIFDKIPYHYFLQHPLLDKDMKQTSRQFFFRHS